MKYIIDIEDEPCVYECGMKFYQCINVPYWNISDRTISKLTPYIEPGRNAIEDEVWEFCMKTDWSWVAEVGKKPLGDYTYQEAKAKYEEWKKKKEDIKVGDEVKYDSVYGKVATVINSYGDYFDAIDSAGKVYAERTKKKWVKTGRHFPEVTELLKKMRGEE